MRFGMVPLELRPAVDRLLSNGHLDLSLFDLPKFVSEASTIDHIQVIEITSDIHYIIPNSLTAQVVDKLAGLRDDLGVTYTVHLPLWSVEPASFNGHIRTASVDTIVEAIDLLSPLDPEAFVLHATGPLAAEFSRLTYTPEIMSLILGMMASYASQSVEEIITKSEISPRLLALENIEYPFEYMREIVDTYDTSICFDTGHLLTHYSGDEPVREFYRRHRDRIAEIHLHDGAFEVRDGVAIHSDHIPLGSRGDAHS